MINSWLNTYHPKNQEDATRALREIMQEIALAGLYWPAQSAISTTKLKDLLTAKIKQVSFEQIKDDVKRFIPDQRILEIWSPKYFLDLIQHMKMI
jgi:hypothetical protein